MSFEVIQKGQRDGRQIAGPRPSMAPDRVEVMNTWGSGPKIQIDQNVELEFLVGAHNQARKLTTGIVKFGPGATLPYHAHPFSESTTVIEGQVVMEVEGRVYTLAV